MSISGQRRFGSSTGAGLRGLVDSAWAGEACVALLLVAVLWLPSLAGSKAWLVPFGLLLVLAAYASARDGKIVPVPATLVAYFGVYALAALHGGSLTVAGVAAFFVKPLVALAVASVVITRLQRRRMLILIVLIAVSEVPVTGFQAVAHGRQTTGDVVTGTLGVSQAGIVTLIALAAATILVGAWLAGAVRARAIVVITSGLVATGVFSGTRAVVAFVVFVGIAMAAAAWSFGGNHPSRRKLLYLAAAAILASPVLYGGMRAFYPNVWVGAFRLQTAQIGATPPAILVSNPCAAKPGSNLVENGGFELGVSPWSRIHSALGTIDRSKAKLVRSSLRLVADGSQPIQAVTSKPVAVCTGKAYRASAWVWAPKGVPIELDLNDYASAERTPVLGTSTWQQVSVTLTAHSPMAYVAIFPQGKRAATIWVDGVVLEQLPQGGTPSHERPAATKTKEPDLSLPTGVELLPGRFAQIELASRLSVRDGLGVWLLGRGIGSSDLTASYLLAQDVPPSQRTGSTWIGLLLTETGWAGLIAFFFLLGWLTLLGRRLWRGGSPAGPDRALGAALPGLAALTGAGAVFTTILSVRSYSIVFWILIGLAISAARELGPPRRAEVENLDAAMSGQPRRWRRS
jgi:hypothetical protein